MAAVPGLSMMFQSAPLTVARGDVEIIDKKPNHQKFQSAPLTVARGDEQTACKPRSWGLVSIRSPHRSKGRFQQVFNHCIGVNGFNPLPSP